MLTSWASSASAATPLPVRWALWSLNISCSIAVSETEAGGGGAVVAVGTGVGGFGVAVGTGVAGFGVAVGTGGWVGAGA